MTTTIEMFNFTRPSMKMERMMTNQEVFDAIIEEVTNELEHPSDSHNTANIYIVKDCYTVELEIGFDAEWVADWQHFDTGCYDFGDWHTARLTDVEVLDCHKTYMVNGEEYDVNLTLDTEILKRRINKIKF